MSRVVQIRRGTASEHDDFTGAIGEVTMDTDNKTLRVHDGETLGGTALAKQSEIPDLGPLDYVIEWQMPNASNSYTWYRKYKSGWVEQGGRVTVSGTISDTNVRITFPVEMANTQYTAICANNANVGIAGYVGWESKTGMSVGTMSPKSGVTFWYVCGMSK